MHTEERSAGAVDTCELFLLTMFVWSSEGGSGGNHEWLVGGKQREIAVMYSVHRAHSYLECT